MLVLLGRTTECGRIDGLLEGARGGESGVLLLRGDPGIGKTALLQQARRRATGMQVVSTRGVESEAELPFAALAELLEPMLDGLSDLPPPQAAAVASALALGPPVPGDAFAVAAGTLNLIVNAAHRAPLLLLVDDAQWLDAASAEMLLFAMRRLDRDRVAALVTIRDGQRSVFDGAGVPELRVRGLDDDAATELLAVSGTRRTSSDVATRLIEAALGNPLALLELPALLDDAQLAGTATLPDPLPLGPSLRRAFDLRLASVPAKARSALLVAAAGESEELATTLGALAAIGLDAEALEPAEKAGLVLLENGRLTWRHPLLRSATYYGASTFERRAAHAALATVSEGVQRAWHSAAATLGPDEGVALELEDAATNARLRRGHVAAATAFERSASLSRSAEDAARRLLEAARDYHLAGRAERTRELARSALASAQDPTVRADLQHLLGVAEMWGGDAASAHQLLLAAADAIEPVDEGRAAAILADAALACQMSGDVPRTLELARRAHDLAASGSSTEPLLLNTLILAGQATAARPALLELVAARPAPGSSQGDPMFLAATAGHALIWIGEHDEARRLFGRELLAARTSGSLALLPFLLACLSELELREGRWQAAYANAVEAVRVAEETVQRNVLAFGLVTLARVEAATAQEEPCRHHVGQALELADELGAGSLRAYALAALGLLELGLGQTKAALGSLEPLAELVEEQGLREPGVLQWTPELIEALVLCGRVDDAGSALARFEADAGMSGNAWALAAAARARGMLAADGFEPEFQAALRGHASPFERARTELRLGERLRRERRPTEARAPLRSALDAFESLGARGWAEQARAELAAAGERRARAQSPLPALLQGLTEQELRIALLVAEGVTNREAAAALFLSPKTIGYHLGKVYDKLGVRSRTELAHVLARA